MGFLDKLSKITSNDAFNVLRSNEHADALKKHGAAFLDARRDVSYQRELNRKLPDATEQTYKNEQQRMADRRQDQEAYRRSDRAKAKTDRRIDMAAAERKRIADAQNNAIYRGKEGKLTKAGYENVAGQQKEALREHIGRRSDAMRGMYNEGKDYFIGGDFTQNAARIGVATAALGAGAVGTRYMTGGSFGYNNSGQRDIAGIPFI